MRLALTLVTALAVAACGGSGSTTTPATDPSGSPPQAQLRYSCGAIPFDPAVLDQPGGAETGADPPAQVLRAHLEGGGEETDWLPNAGWILVGATPIAAEYVARNAAGELHVVSVEMVGGAWQVGGWGGCTPQVVLDGLSVASWVFDPDASDPGPEATTFTALVTERACASGKGMGARLQPPLIVYRDTDVLVVFAATPLGGNQDCPSNPSTRVVVELEEPLGDRQLLDASQYPPADPAAPPE